MLADCGSIGSNSKAFVYYISNISQNTMNTRWNKHKIRWKVENQFYKCKNSKWQIILEKLLHEA